MWDPSTGIQTPIVPWRFADGRTHVEIELAPVGSAFVVWEDGDGVRVHASDIAVDSIADGRVSGHAEGGTVSLTVERDGREHVLSADAGPAIAPIELADGWQIELEDANALVITEWKAAPEQAGTDVSQYAARTLEETGEWLPMVQGAWSFQIPTEPDEEYPIAVWYRVHFAVDERPEELQLLVDGFAGIEWSLHVNGAECDATARGVAASTRRSRRSTSRRSSRRATTCWRCGWWSGARRTACSTSSSCAATSA